MTTHYVKSWTHLFKPIKEDKKLYDLRKNDRDYKVGDLVLLQEYDPKEGTFTGDGCAVEVTYITNNQFPCAYSAAVLPKDYCILGYKKVEK